MLENKTAFTCLNLPERIARYNEQRPQHVANINKATENLSSAITGRPASENCLIFKKGFRKSTKSPQD